MFLEIKPHQSVISNEQKFRNCRNKVKHCVSLFDDRGLVWLEMRVYTSEILRGFIVLSGFIYMVTKDNALSDVNFKTKAANIHQSPHYILISYYISGP